MNGGNKNSLSYGIKLTAFASLAFFITVASLYTDNSRASHYVAEASFVNPLALSNNDFPKPENESLFTKDSTELRKGNRVFRFSENEDGNNIRYKAKLNNGKLDELYVDGKKVPDNELINYSTKVEDKIAEHEFLVNEYRKNKNEYKKLSKEYSKKMREQQKKLNSFGNRYYKNHFDFEFNFEASDFSGFRESMRELRRSLKENFAGKSIVIPPIHIPEINIPEIELPEIHIPPIHISKIDIHEFSEFNNEKWDDWQKELNEKMKELDMSEFKESMKEYKMNMGKFKTEMKKFGTFMDSSKEEMVKDNLIETEDDLDSFFLSEDKFVINGKEVLPEIHTKYLDMYENYTGKKLEGDKKIRINY